MPARTKSDMALECLVDIGAGVGDAHLVEIDPLGLQPAQRVLDRFDDPAPPGAAMVGVLVHRKTELHRQHHVVAAAAGQRLAEDQFRLTGGIAVGGVDEVDPGIERLVDDSNRVVVVGVAECAEHHRTEAQLS